MKIKALVKSAALAALCTLPASAQALDGFNCKVTEVAVFSDRVHVKCSATTPISYYAVPTAGNSAEAARFTTMASMALGGYLYVEYEFYGPDTGSSFGCLGYNCRRALSFALR